MKNIRVIIFDDSARILDALTMLIGGTDGFHLVQTFTDCSHLIDRVQDTEPDVILMDIDMPEINGIEAVGMIKKQFPKVQVLMQTIFDDDDKVFDSICAGADGYILKNTTPSKLLDSIREVYEGGSPMSTSIARKVLHMFQEKERPKHKEDYKLSHREKEVLELLVKGQSYKMIAEELNISYETVRSHMKNIYEKLHVTSMTEAVAKTLNQKLLK